MKAYTKAIARFAAGISILPFVLSYWLLACCTTFDSALTSHSQLLSLVPGRLGSYLRVAFYRRVLEACDRTATIEFGVLFSKANARVGKHVYIGAYSHIGWVAIEDDVLIGPSVQLMSGPSAHTFERLDIPIRDQPSQLQRLNIGRDSWIGGGSIVFADVLAQSVVGAGSVVTKTYPPRSVIVGNPGRVLRSRDHR